MAEVTIGERIRELRKCAVLAQYDLAVVAGVGVHAIRQLEQGWRQIASIATLACLARVLGVDLAELLGRPSVAPAGGESWVSVVAIRDALASVDDLLGELDDVDAPDLTELGRVVRYCFGLYWAGRYGQLAALLPAC
jgi:transcriptional regulator with XRE-family HTH domain